MSSGCLPWHQNRYLVDSAVHSIIDTGIRLPSEDLYKHKPAHEFGKCASVLLITNCYRIPVWVFNPPAFHNKNNKLFTRRAQSVAYLI